MSPKKQAVILDIGSVSSTLAKAISEFGKGKWQVFRIDIAESDCDLRMDARITGFGNEVFNQVICKARSSILALELIAATLATMVTSKQSKRSYAF